MPNTLSSRYSSTSRIDHTLIANYNYTSRERTYRSNSPTNALTIISRNQCKGARLAEELKQFLAEELDLEDFLATVSEFSPQVKRRFSPLLVSTLREHASRCHDCDRWTCNDDITEIDGNDICDSCRENYFSCESCEELIHSDDTTFADDACYCRSCYSRLYTSCNRCGDSVANNNTREVNGSDWCESCCDNYAHYCESGGEYRISPCEDCDCESCHGDDCECRHCLLVLDYSTTLCGPLATPLPDNRIQNHIMGCELECEVSDRQEFAKQLRSAYPASICHCKRDGSLDSDTGVEIVTGHGTQSQLLAVIETAANLARHDFEGQSHNGDSCGLHIGLDRSQFSSALQAKIIVFWNSGENYQFLRQFTRRDYRNLSYCAIKPEKASDAFIARPDLSSREKYEIVNTRHATHLEFRGFRGSLLPRTLRACVSLVSLIASYCEVATTAAELTSGRFIDWLLRDVPQDDPRRIALIAYLVNRGKQLEHYAANATPAGLASYPLFNQELSA